MAETAQKTNEQNIVQKWSRAGVLVAFAVMVFGFICLRGQWFLIPPLFKLNIPLYLFGWLVVLILWVIFTPARKRILLMLVPGLPITLLALVFSLPSLFPYFLIPTERCLSLSDSGARLYACNTGGLWTAEEFTLFKGSQFLPFMKLTGEPFPTGVDLSGEDLSFKQLDYFDLSGANLEGANLRGASLWNADLSNANLRGADLSRADLTAADFESADLRGANLEGAVLNKTNFSQATLDPGAIEEDSRKGNPLMPKNPI